MADAASTILVTGGTTGLGFYAASTLASQFRASTIIIASRKDTGSVAAAIQKATGHRHVRFVPLDLGSQDNIRAFVNHLEQEQYAPISMLLLNAGIQVPEGVKYTSDGIEATFGVNHVGHALLFHLLQPHLAAEARIVVTASDGHDPARKTGLPDAHYTTAERLAHPAGEALKDPGTQRYTTSKLCNVLWTYALFRRLGASPARQWTIVAFDPGMMPGTGLAREYPAFVRFLWSYILPRVVGILRILVSKNVHLPQESGANLAWVAGQDTTTSGVYYEGRKQIESSVESYDTAKQDDLWKWTVKTLASNADELKEFDMAV
ncbi:hypothetical protein A1O1_02137 [Capronia coronata CBS 617.96]|uniref:Uncharacterized protein n=1 Tax=Capronia coronata CBS 617.96 TaxID=1182541 RepID=W9ZGV4_9EURO|nr:uncharacterized protein A1O1_02137 [Capronia coronata CBS 617.96]EXJ93744.1 hypothetical protein A1O1_02137 [Capronia coronata CBS 617.96]